MAAASAAADMNALLTVHSEPVPLGGSQLLRSYAAANSAARDQAALLPMSLDVELAHDAGRLQSVGLARKLAQLQSLRQQDGSPTIAAGNMGGAGGSHGQQQNVHQLTQMISALPDGVVNSLISLLQTVNVQQM
jgi:hypothetical protein